MIQYTENNHLMDSTDLGTTRKTRKLSEGEKADVIDSFIAVISISTFIADISTDILAAHQYYVQSHWTWFGLTVLFIVIPSLVMQFLSCKWYYDDDGAQSWWSKVLHIMQLGPVQRYCHALWCGLKTNCMSKINKEDFNAYLTNWRDVTMLRLIEAFLESAPQVVLQLYILSQLGRKIEWKEDWVTLISVLISITSLAWSIVSYTHALRLSAKEKGLSICGYTFQVIYRLCMVASRIVALVLLASEYRWVVFVVVFVHWFLMIYWLHFHGTQFCSSPNLPNRNEDVEKCLDRLFSILMAFIHIFCFINTQDGATRQRVMGYYILIFVENSVMIACWYPTRKDDFGWLEYSALCFVWGGFILGLLSMLIYYKLFHPNQDITAGWLCCVICTNDEKQDSDFTSASNDSSSGKQLTASPSSVYHMKSDTTTPKSSRRLVKRSGYLIPIDVELSARGDHSPGNNRRNDEITYHKTENEEKIENLDDAYMIDTLKIGNGSTEKGDMNSNGYGGSYGSLDVVLHKRSTSHATRNKSDTISSFDESGVVTQIIV